MGTVAAYTLGLHAQRRGEGYNTNPYTPENNPIEFEAWMDGWAVASIEVPIS